MEIAELHHPPRNADSYAWTLVLPRRAGPGKTLRPEQLNASEQMFFFGAPLAHVVRYEEHLKAMRHEKAARVAARSRRAPELTLLSFPERSSANGR